MRTTKHTDKTYGVTNYHADRPMHVAPVIKKEYKDADGTRMYKSVDGRDFIADMFDKMFKVIPTQMKPKNFKGDNAIYKRIGRIAVIL